MDAVALSSWLTPLCMAILIWMQMRQAKVSKEIHVLVNSERGVALKVGALALARVAALTKDPQDLLAARAAMVLYNTHKDQQNTVDESK